MRTIKSAHDIWNGLCTLHERTKSEREKRFDIVSRKINEFKMLPHENANAMYSRLNVLVEELNGLNLIQMSKADVVRKIVGLLPKDKYAHIVTFLHQGDFTNETPANVLRKINSHEMYMEINPDESSTSSKEKNLALKATQKKTTNKKIILVNTSEDDKEESDKDLALLVRRAISALKKLNKKGIKYSSSKNKFFASKKKPIEGLDCYKCGELGHLAHQCKFIKSKKDGKHSKHSSSGEESDDEDEDEKKKKKKSSWKNKKDHKKRGFTKKGKAYIGE